MKILGAMLAALILVVLLGPVLYVGMAAPSYRWHAKCFTTLDKMVNGLNSLPVIPSDVEVITVPSSRNFGGILGSPYCFVYAQ